ncbi:MAG: glycosyltransferase family 1 protein [Burkholderiaceae bacterium]
MTTRPTGVGHYLMAAVNVWSEQRADVDFVLLAHKPLHPQAASALRRAANVRFDVCPTAHLPTNGLWWLARGFSKRAKSIGATHLWGAGGMLPPAGGAGLATLLTVHDLVYRSLPWTMSARSRVAHSIFAGRSIRNADVIWAVSEYTAREIERFYPHRRAKQTIIGCGLNPLRACAELTPQRLSSFTRHYGVHDRTLLFVGTTEPRKNVGFLLSLMPQLARSGCALLIVGCGGWGRSDLASIVEADNFPRESVRFCDYVPDEDLQALYRSAAFFVSASLMEGFGLPHLEAMSAGCPVIAAANSAVIEVVSAGGCLIEGWDRAHWVRSIEQAFEKRDALKSAAHHNALRHSIANACSAASAFLQTDR